MGEPDRSTRPSPSRAPMDEAKASLSSTTPRWRGARPRAQSAEAPFAQTRQPPRPRPASVSSPGAMTYSIGFRRPPVPARSRDLVYGRIGNWSPRRPSSGAARAQRLPFCLRRPDPQISGQPAVDRQPRHDRAAHRNLFRHDSVVARLDGRSLGVRGRLIDQLGAWNATIVAPPRSFWSRWSSSPS